MGDMESFEGSCGERERKEEKERKKMWGEVREEEKAHSCIQRHQQGQRRLATVKRLGGSLE